MNDIIILHLSDLHIDDSKKSYSRLLKNLLADIEKEIKHIEDNTLVVVVTGDIIHQGKKAATKVALKFFQDLKNKLGNKVAGIYMVPGNHDKYRTKENLFLIPAYRMLRTLKDDEFDKSFYESFWKFQLDTYESQNGSGYLELTKDIYRLFGQKSEDEKSYVQNTFGVDLLKINGKNFCFVLLNTAWSCIDDSDSRNLVLGKFQIDEIKRQYNDLTSELDSNLDHPHLTLVMGHHPIGCLYGKEEDNIFSEMMAFEELDANAYLCGHTHDRTVINWVNNWHSLNTFMTGIGWPETKNAQHVGFHYYSFYVFNLDANSVDIYVRATNDGGHFHPEFRIYTNEETNDKKKIVFPIKSHLAQTYISLGAGPERSQKAIYISEAFLDVAKRYTLNVARLRQEIGTMIESDKNELLENAIIDDSLAQENILKIFDEVQTETAVTTEYMEEIDPIDILYNYLFVDSDCYSCNDKMLSEIFDKNRKILNDMFLGFLQKICQKIQIILLNDFYEEDDIVRVHFRYLSDRSVFNYTKLCTSFPDEMDSNGYELTDIKYGELIEAAHKSSKPLIYSVNKELCDNGLKSKWKNFITIVPEFKGNIYVRKVSETREKKVPFITFGVTANSEKFDKILYCMDYFSIDIMLKEMINTYLGIFRINTDQFCNWLKEELKKERS